MGWDVSIRDDIIAPLPQYIYNNWSAQHAPSVDAGFPAPRNVLNTQQGNLNPVREIRPPCWHYFFRLYSISTTL